jgi:predicted deacylase
MTLPILSTGSGEPELWVVAGVHGDEVEGIGCVEKALATASLQRGTLVGVPVANPSALVAGTRFGVDGLDLNRTYPGRPDGRPTQRVAHQLYSALVDRASALVTLHSWSREGLTAPYVEYDKRDEEGRSLACALGIGFVEGWDWPDGLLPKVCASTGIPAVEVEIGGLGRHTSAGLEQGVRAVRAAAGWLGLAEPQETPAGVEVARHWLKTSTSGRIRQVAAVGSAIDVDERVCEVRALDGALSETLRSPVSGWVGIHLTYGWAEEGQDVAVLFERL